MPWSTPRLRDLAIEEIIPMVDPTTGSESDGEGLGTRSSSPLARVDSDGFGKADERPRRLCRVRGAWCDGECWWMVLQCGMSGRR